MKIYSDEQIRLALIERNKSGLSMSEFARRRGIAIPTFHGWEKRARERPRKKIADQASSDAFLPVVVKSEEEHSQQIFEPVKLQIGEKLMLQIPVTTPVKWLQELVRGLSC